MRRTETIITVPCSVGDRFWIIDPLCREVVQVECSGYYVSRDAKIDKYVDCLWMDSMSKSGDYWKIPFDEFDERCFNTRKEAERSR